MKATQKASTGLPGLDEILNNLQVGDNVVWQVDTMADYRTFVDPFVEKALADGKRFNYMRFASHEPLVEERPGVRVHTLDAYSGFETFSKQVYTIITEEGDDAYYVFDCLSDLLSAWATDLMIGNFFAITCPYLYELNTVAYFALLRDSHSFKTIARIREITQLLIDAYDCDGDLYVHPLKVLNRYSPTMFFPHHMKGDAFVAITRSEDATKFISSIQQRGGEKTRRNLDFWDRLFLKAELLLDSGADPAAKQGMVDRLCRVMIGREERLLGLASGTFPLEELVSIKNRMIGTGYIGGKAAGMLIARGILQKDRSRNWNEVLEPHDSFYIGSDVFYSYIVQNGWWKMLMEQQTPGGYFTVAQELGDKMLRGSFPDEIKEQFQEMIEYLGQSPIIVRSSSLLEDSFGNAFAGKYESYFLVNQGSPRQRYLAFTEAVRKIYASTMNEDALAYRLQRGLSEMEEQMALLVQRVSGTHHGSYFFPDIGGVGFSYNAYVWKGGLDPEAGMLRLAMGLGTRAVNRVEGDYPRIVALDDPGAKPLTGMDDMRRFSQHDVDILDIDENIIRTLPLADLIKKDLKLPMDRIGLRDLDAERKLVEMGAESREYWVITFDDLLLKTPFTDDMRGMMSVIAKRYEYPVDIEFTVNFSMEGGYRVNLLQCRPHQVKGIGKRVELPEHIPDGKVLFNSTGNFLGGSTTQPLKRIVYVDPHRYSALPLTQKYDIARTVGRINKAIGSREETPTLLIGPGRWGTTTPSLGVPVRFAEINHIAVLVELAIMSDNVLPELSFGTHFFQDLVETDIFYVALFPDSCGVCYRREFLDGFPSVFETVVPDGAAYRDVIRVYDVTGAELELLADIVSQRIVCYAKK
ncbi:MAG: PEP/pyruvate-binding domain-containing protein [Spirochaetes bacterium]|nr:PEP/pyruvate-binding domain-containing protein [Spirochaetota bacterium]